MARSGKWIAVLGVATALAWAALLLLGPEAPTGESGVARESGGRRVPRR